MFGVKIPQFKLVKKQYHIVDQSEAGETISIPLIISPIKFNFLLEAHTQIKHISSMLISYIPHASAILFGGRLSIQVKQRYVYMQHLVMSVSECVCI